MDEIERALAELLPLERGKLFEMARYSLEGGKRIRPRLTLAVLESHEIPIETGLHPACAIEMIHTYSLIHDDLPSMDDDDLRRGRATLHRAFPESHAVLTGDFLLTYAFQVVAESPHLSEGQKNQMIALLALRAGSEGMVGGQLLDIEESDDLQMMHQKKTGALFSCSLEFGAIIAKQATAPYQAIGETLGLAFQAADDLLDGDGIVAIHGEERARALVEDLYSEALSKIQRLEQPAPQLEVLAQEMVFRRV